VRLARRQCLARDVLPKLTLLPLAIVLASVKRRVRSDALDAGLRATAAWKALGRGARP